MTHLIKLALLTAVALTPLSLNAQTADQIMARVEARNDGDNATSVMEMILIDKSGHQRKRSIRSFTKDKGPDTQRLMFFLEPADVRGTGFLTYDFGAANKDDDQWMYLPELRKTKRIAASDKFGSFMGSDFSFADMTGRELEEWNLKLLGEKDVRGKNTWLIEAMPASRKVRDRYGYEKSVIFVQQDNYVVVRAVHWLRDGRLKYLDVKKLAKKSGIWVGTEIEMRTVRAKKTEHTTILRLRDIKYGQNLNNSLFTIRKLEQGL
jgi:outer membrane lipoprotein-sorting protein